MAETPHSSRRGPPPGLPMKKGRLGTMTHDYKRNGTTTLFAALNVLDGTVIGRNMQRHRHKEFIRFLNVINARVPADKAVHIILDNYAAHSIRRFGAGLNATSGLFSTSRQHPARGSTPSKGSSPSSRNGASSGVSSILSSISKPPSIASSPRPTRTPNPSPGQPIQIKSLLPSKEGTKR